LKEVERVKGIEPSS